MSVNPTTQQGTAPWLVAMLRGAIEAAVIAAISGALVVLSGALGGPDAPAWAVAVLPLVTFGARSIEGLADQRIDPTVQRGRLGGGPAS